MSTFTSLTFLLNATLSITDISRDRDNIVGELIDIDTLSAMIGILISRRSTTASWRSGNQLVADWPSKCRSWKNAQACPALWRLSVGSSRTPHWEERLEMPRRPSPRSKNARPRFCTLRTSGMRILYICNECAQNVSSVCYVKYTVYKKKMERFKASFLTQRH